MLGGGEGEACMLGPMYAWTVSHPGGGCCVRLSRPTPHSRLPPPPPASFLAANTDPAACNPSAQLSYCPSLETALVSLPQGTYITKVFVSGRVGIDHLVLSSSLLQVMITAAAQQG